MLKYLMALMLFFTASLSADEAHLKLIPADMNIAIGMNLNDIMAIPLIKQQLEANQEEVKKLEKAGLKYGDFQSVTIAVKLASEKDLMAMQKPKVVVVLGLKSAPDEAKLLASATEEGAKVSSEQLGRKINIIEQNGEKMGFIVEGNNIIIGTLDEVRSAVRTINGTADNLSSSKMMKTLLKPKNMLYAGGTLKDSDQFNGFSVVCNYKNGLQLFLRGYCKSGQVAQQLLMQANMGVAMAKQEMQLTDQNLKVSAKGNIISVGINLSQQKIMDMVAKAMMSFNKMGPGPGGPPSGFEGEEAEIEPAPAE